MLVPSASEAEPTNEASMPEPRAGLPWVSRGGQASRQSPSQFLLSGSSIVNMYNVIPLPSTRIGPRVGSVATLITASAAVATGWVIRGVDVAWSWLAWTDDIQADRIIDTVASRIISKPGLLIELKLILAFMTLFLLLVYEHLD